MNKFFKMDGKLFTILSRITDLVLLNILWLISCLPLFTIGASTAALYSVTLKMVKNEESYIIRSFFSAFKKNFRQATVLWICTCLSATFLYYDSFICSQIASFTSKIVLYLVGLCGFLLTITVLLLYPVQAYFDNSIKGTLCNSFLMILAHLPCTALLLLLTAGPGGMMLLFTQILIPVIFLYLSIGFALTAYINSFLLRKIFSKHEL